MTYLFGNNNGKNNDNFNFDYKLDLNKYQDDCLKVDLNDHTDFTSSILNKMRSIFPWTSTTTHKPIEIKLEKTPTFKYVGISPEALNLEWNKAATRILDYLYYSENPSYDFKIDGVPVKVHGNYIQVGTTLIPTYTKSSFFDKLKKKERENIYNISLTINLYLENNSYLRA